MTTQITNDGGAPPRIHDEESLERAAGIISALDSVLRIRILLALREREHVVHELVSALGKSQPLISQHLRVLKHAGIVDSQRSGREVVYRISSQTAVNIIDAAADAAAEIHGAATAVTIRDDLAVKRQLRDDQQARDLVPAGTGAAVPVGPEGPAPEPGLSPGTPTPPDQASR